MAHFARLDDNNQVVAVHVLNNEVITVDGVEDEALGVSFLTQLHDHTNWKQTSYSGAFRKRYATVGGSYSPEFDAFIPPKPFLSWLLDEVTCDWIPPTPRPTDGADYYWFERNLEWIPVTDTFGADSPQTGDTA